MDRVRSVAAGLTVAALGVGAAAPVASQAAGLDWPATSGDRASRRYSPLDQIDRDNVAQLEPVWRWSSTDNRLMQEDERFQSARMRPRNHEAGPIKIGSRIFLTTGFSQMSAIDVATGKTLWTHDPRSYDSGRPTNLGFVHRGAAYWKDENLPNDPGRLVWGGGDARLRAVSAESGEPIASFGESGVVDLTQGLHRPVDRRRYAVSSPVVLCRNVAIVGSSISDGARNPEGPPGDVRGFDVRTGRQLWAFHSVPHPGEPGHETWEEGSWEYTGNTNVWTMMSADEELGLAYLPFGTPTNDWFGGHRKGANLFAESLVAVDCETGVRKWHFQMVHHGLWDYDLPTAAILGDVRVGSRTVKAAMQLSKQAFLYVFDRETGEPVWPIEEREVPQSGVFGEKTSPTKPPPFDRQGITFDDLTDFTPEIHAEAKRLLSQYQYGPIFTPPSERGTLLMPGYAGGASWPGGAFDPETGMLYVPSFTWPVVMTLRKPDATRSSFDYVGSVTSDLRGPFDLPLLKPPYSRITAYDLTRGDIAWTIPIGEGPRRHPMLRDLDLPLLGSGARAHVLVTKTLLFVTSGHSLALRGQEAEAQEEWEGSLKQKGGARDWNDPRSGARNDWRYTVPTLQAYDKATGELVAELELPAHTDGSPITFLHEGRQFLVFALGGRGAAFELVAFALPS